MSAEETRAVLEAYKQVMTASWPALHPAMAERSKAWPGTTDAQLQSELDGYLAESATTGRHVRIFWKRGPEMVFGGGNALFARDAGVPAAADLVGRDDFDDRLPWTRQAAKYRADDDQVFYSGRPQLDIVERQKHHDETIWVRVGKVPIVTGGGHTIGVFGMYEVLDPEVGRKLYAERLARVKGTTPKG